MTEYRIREKTVVFVGETEFSAADAAARAYLKQRIKAMLGFDAMQEPHHCRSPGGWPKDEREMMAHHTRLAHYEGSTAAIDTLALRLAESGNATAFIAALQTAMRMQDDFRAAAAQTAKGVKG